MNPRSRALAALAAAGADLAASAAPAVAADRTVELGGTALEQKWTTAES